MGQAYLAAHLARCESCRGFEAQLAALTASLREAPLERPLRPVVLPRRSRLVLAALRPVATAAAVVAVVAGLAGVVAGPRNPLAGSPERARLAGVDGEERYVRGFRRMQLTTITGVLQMNADPRRHIVY